MPGWAKALLIIGVIILLLVVGVVGVGVYWWTQNKDALMTRAKQVATEGQEFGRSTDNQGCMDETISRYKKEPGFRNAISVSIFNRMCLDASHPTQGFCTDVPKPTEFVKSAQWRVAQCTKIGLASDSYCQQLFQPMQEYCAKPSRSD